MKTTHEILRDLPYAIYVVGVRGQNGEHANALLVSWLTQCSFDPPLIMMAVRRDSRSYDLIQESQAFSVNMLDRDQKEAARRFVKPSDRVGDKLEPESRAGTETGAPVLNEAFAALECRVKNITECGGDHAIVIGEVVNSERSRSGQPLMCADMHWTYGG